RSDFANHQAHQIDQRGKQNLARILAIGYLPEQQVQMLRPQQVFQNPTHHHTDRTALQKRLQGVAEQHPCLLRECRRTIRWDKVLPQMPSTCKGWPLAAAKWCKQSLLFSPS